RVACCTPSPAIASEFITWPGHLIACGWLRAPMTRRCGCGTPRRVACCTPSPDMGGPVYHVAWSPDGVLLASGSDDSLVRLWNPQTGRLLHTLSGHSDWVTQVAWSPDGTRLASGSLDSTVRLWN